MIVYEATKQEFVRDALQNLIAKKIENLFKEKIRRSINPREDMSWRNSIQYMKNILEDEDIPQNSGVAIEYKIPNTGNRIDFILSGKNEKDKNIAIIIELKQWQKAEAIENKDGIINTEIEVLKSETGKVKTFTGGALREVTHPSYQAWSYAAFIKDYNENVQNENIELYPCAYLHNYEETEPPQITNPIYKEYIDKAPVFMENDFMKLRNFIKKFVKYGDNKETLYLIEDGKLKPSKSLQDCIANMIKGNSEFILLEDQKIAHETALDMARNCKIDGKKRCLIIKGGPGTGKTVLAIQLLSELTNKPYEMACNFVTKNSSVREVFKAKLKGNIKVSSVDNMFKGSGSYIDTPKNTFDVILVDEAHRLNEKSGMFHNMGDNQIKEIINATKLSIFFVDNNQRVTTYDIGTTDEIYKCIEEFNIEKSFTKTIELKSQFRCNGSDGYLAWLDSVLEIRETANENGFDIDYDIQVFDNPNDIKNFIFEKNKKNNKARIVAGYCWNWEKKQKTNKDYYDITIPEFNFEMSWNLGNTSTWAIDENSVNEAGCIHTCQGLEFDYVGVIIGKDLRFENGHIITDFFERANTDQSIKGLKTLYKNNKNAALKEADMIIKNTYRTLMTRGQKGCYIYCEDKALSEYLKRRLEIKNKNYEEENKNQSMKVAEESEEYKTD